MRDRRQTKVSQLQKEEKTTANSIDKKRKRIELHVANVEIILEKEIRFSKCTQKK